MLSNSDSAYKELLERNKNIIVLGSAEALVNWDMETMMPPKAVELRSEQLALLSQIHHKMITAPAMGRLIAAILGDPNYSSLKEEEKRNVQLIKKNHEEQAKLPTKLVTAITKQQTITVNTWKKAKAAKNFSIFKPELEKLITLNKQAAEILKKVKETKTAYDAFLDIYEPKITSENFTKIFSELQEGLKTLLAKIENACQRPEKNVLTENISPEKQREIAKMLMQSLGYETPPSPNSAGRLDETEHPFTTGYYDDVRITTHYYPVNFASSIFSVLHETGHALYEQGLPQNWKYQPIGSPCSMGFHESQSRLYENIIGRSSEFWTFALPKMKNLAKPNLTSLTLDRFIRSINSVKPSKIRIEADEVTYSLHVIIRFQIEKEIFAGKVNVNELPALWNQKYKEIMGIRVENDSEGVMQDTHWASGLYGYFPTYALGNIYSGQIANAIQQESPNWRNELAQGSLLPIRKWLSNNIYNQGNLYDPNDLIKKATGSEIKVKTYLKYLEEKYSKLYGF